MKTIINVLTNQYFLMFITIVTGLLIGKIKIKNFSLGVSGGIFTGIVIGWIVTKFANNAVKGSIGYADAKRILNTGVVSPAFFTFFLLLFLCAIGLSSGKNIGSIFRRYGMKFVVIGAIIPLVSMIVAVGCFKLAGPSISSFDISGMYSGAMTSTPAYGAALDVVSSMEPTIGKKYESSNVGNQMSILSMIDKTGTLTPENTPVLNEEQVAAFKTAASSAVSLGYTVTFPMGVLVIVIMINLLPKFFGINIEKEKEKYNKELIAIQDNSKVIKDGPVDFAMFTLTAAIGYAVGNITIPLGSFGSFSLGGAGGVLIVALLLSYIGKIGPFNFRMDTKTLSVIRDMGLTFFMADVGLTYGYQVINSLSGSGLTLAVMAIAVEAIAVLVSFIIGRYLFKLNWVLLSGAICGGCTSAPGLGATLSQIGNDEPASGYGAAQPFAILTNVLLITIFHQLFFI